MRFTMSSKQRQLYMIGLACDLLVITRGCSYDFLVIFSEDEQSNEKRPNSP